MHAALLQRKDVLDALSNKGVDMTAEDALGNNLRRLVQRGRRSGPECTTVSHQGAIGPRFDEGLVLHI